MSTDESTEPILPILNRRAPLLERLRNRTAQKVNDIANEIGRKVAQSALTSGRANEEFIESFRQGVADELDVQSEQISDTAVTRFTNLFMMDIDDLVIIEEQEQEEEEEIEEEVEETEEEEQEESEEDDTPTIA